MANADRPAMVHLPMACTCGAERAARAREAMDRVLARLSAGSRSLRARPVTRESFLSDVCLSLQADYRVLEVRIVADQWFAVVAEQLVGDDERQIVGQAEAAEDGLAAIWAYLADEAEAGQPS
jgi:hypothetical protein